MNFLILGGRVSHPPLYNLCKENYSVEVELSGRGAPKELTVGFKGKNCVATGTEAFKKGLAQIGFETGLETGLDDTILNGNTLRFKLIGFGKLGLKFQGFVKESHVLVPF